MHLFSENKESDFGYRFFFVFFFFFWGGGGEGGERERENCRYIECRYIECRNSPCHILLSLQLLLVSLLLPHSRNEKDKKKINKLACLKIINNYTVTTQTIRKYAKTIKK